MPDKQTFGIIDASLAELTTQLRALAALVELDDRSAGYGPRLTELLDRLTTEERHLRLRFALPKPRVEEEPSLAATEARNLAQDELDGLIHQYVRACQEVSRILEEYFRFFKLGSVSRSYKRARFELYDVERELIRALGPAKPVVAKPATLAAGFENRVSRALNACPLYFILDESLCVNRDPLRVGYDAITAGVRMLQVRFKSLSTRELVDLCLRLRQVCSERDCLLIINDRLDIALVSGADGIHVGATDLTTSEIRRLAPGMLVGVTARSVKEALTAVEVGADYLGVGSVFPSKTKQGLPVVGLRGLAGIAGRISQPVAAIGGITLENCQSVMTTGAAGFCAVRPFSQLRSVKNLVTEFRRTARAGEKTAVGGR